MCDEDAGKGLDSECELFIESGFHGTESHVIESRFTACGQRVCPVDPAFDFGGQVELVFAYRYHGQIVGLKDQ